MTAAVKTIAAAVKRTAAVLKRKHVAAARKLPLRKLLKSPLLKKLTSKANMSTKKIPGSIPGIFFTAL